MRLTASVAVFAALVMATSVVVRSAGADNGTAPDGRRERAVRTPPPTRPPLEPVEVANLPAGVERVELFLLLGQSNMKGRGVMPDEPKRDPRVIMMHLRDDRWYLARHPLHLTGDATSFAGADNAGVGPGLSFAETLAARDPKVRIGLVPCAVGGSSIRLWQKGAKLYDEAVRRAKLAVENAAPVKGRIRGALWLQGEADAKPEALPDHKTALLRTIADLRADLGLPDLPFIACTIGELAEPDRLSDKAAMNAILLALPGACRGTACVDARDLKGHIGDRVHFDAASQTEIGRRYAAEWIKLVQP